MRLGLRMGLNSRQSGGGDLPSLDLAFALDKTLTARKGPTPGFTRVQETSTGSTYVGADRLIKYAAANEPRFDHDPVTGLCKGLLIEESRENRILRSEEFEHSNWVKTNISVSQDSIIAPNGLSTADLLQSVATSSSNVFASSVATATAVTYSIYTKKGNVATRFFLLRNSTTATNFQLGTINYDTATISGAGWTIQTLSNGWYRIAFTQSTGITLGDTLLAYCGMKGDIDTAGSTWSVWGAQVEAGAFPLSYIPTTSGTAARSADVCSIAGTDFSSFYNQSEGTTLLVGDTLMSSTHFAGRSIYSYNNGSYASTLGISKSSGGASITTGGNGLTTLIQSLPTLTSQFKSAVALATNGVVTSCLNTSTADLTGTFTGAAFTRLTFHDATTNGAFWHSGHIARITYFRKRLSNAKLQTITAP